MKLLSIKRSTTPPMTFESAAKFELSKTFHVTGASKLNIRLISRFS